MLETPIYTEGPIGIDPLPENYYIEKNPLLANVPKFSFHDLVDSAESIRTFPGIYENRPTYIINISGFQSVLKIGYDDCLSPEGIEKLFDKVQTSTGKIQIRRPIELINPYYLNTSLSCTRQAVATTLSNIIDNELTKAPLGLLYEEDRVVGYVLQYHLGKPTNIRKAIRVDPFLNHRLHRLENGGILIDRQGENIIQGISENGEIDHKLIDLDLNDSLTDINPYDLPDGYLFATRQGLGIHPSFFAHPNYLERSIRDKTLGELLEKYFDVIHRSCNLGLTYEDVLDGNAFLVTPESFNAISDFFDRYKKYRAR